MDWLRFCVRLFIVQIVLLTGAGANADDWLYTIKPGDTLWKPRAQSIDRHDRLSEPGQVVRWTNKVVELWLALVIVIVALLLVVRFR